MDCLPMVSARAPKLPVTLPSDLNPAVRHDLFYDLVDVFVVSSHQNVTVTDEHHN